MKKSKYCTGLFDHSMDQMKTVKITKHHIFKVCGKCNFTEVLPRSTSVILFMNGNLLQTKKWGADDNRRELLQPLRSDGAINDEFTAAYGYNPFDDRTKDATPWEQGGNA